MWKKLTAILSEVLVHFGFNKVPFAEAFYNSRTETLVVHV